MISLPQFLILMALCTSTLCQEWFMPDSHLINEQEFQQLVINDKTTFKIVKYFSPNCGFCRYLKQVVDKLKHQKEWCFQIYDFNCAWYPQHCMQNVKSPSFPYTAIHNGEGGLHQEIHGFYPEPVIRPIFERIEASCQQLKNKISNPQSIASNGQSSLTNTPQEQIKSQIKIEQASTNNQQNQQVAAEDKTTQPKPDEGIQVEHTKSDEPKKEAPQQLAIVSKGEAKHSRADVGVDSQHKEHDYVKYFIYGITLLISIFYFHHINKGKSNEKQPQTITTQNQQSVPLMQTNNQISQQQKQVQQIIKEQSQLLDSIPDESL